MTLSLDDYDVTGSWTDIGATLAAIISTDVSLMNVSDVPVFVVFGGGTVPASTKTGHKVLPGSEIQGNAANVWVKTRDAARLAVATL